MTGPHRNHVEARSSRAPARQYVSESHDHKPDAPERVGLTKAQIYLGLSYSKDVIIAAKAQLATDFENLHEALVRMNAAFDLQSMVEVKLAMEDVQRHAAQVEHHGWVMKGQAAGILKASTEHLNRRPRP